MLNNDGDNADSFSRKKAEELIAQSFLPHVFSSSSLVTRLYNRKKIPAGLTDQENRTLSKYTYFATTAAVASGFGVFVTLFGGLRFAKHLAQRRPSFQLSQSKHHVEMAQKRAEYLHLDQAPSKGSPKSSGTTLAPQEPAKETSDIVMQIQFLFCSAISLCVAIMTGNKYSDSHQVFNDNIAVLPLQTGTSIFCERYLCPNVLTYHTKLQLQPMTYEAIYMSIEDDRRQKAQRLKTDNREANDNSAKDTPENAARAMWRSYDQDALVPTPNEIYNTASRNTAVTAELGAMQRLVYHCECRQDFEQKCRQHGQALDPRTDLVNVPVNTGVPLRFLASTGGKEDSA